jgi:hypothetical protein
MAHTLRPDSARMSGTTMPAKTGERKGFWVQIKRLSETRNAYQWRSR